MCASLGSPHTGEDAYLAPFTSKVKPPRVFFSFLFVLLRLRNEDVPTWEIREMTFFGSQVTK